jgi:tetratricopeptide (TPR) repeat protein
MMSYMTGKPDDARQGFAVALETYTARRHVAGQAACHTALGNVARAKDPEAAAKEFADASELLDRAGDRHGLAEILNNRADLELKIHGPSAALAVYHVSLPIQEEIGDQRGAARAHHGIGKCLLATGDPAGALKAFRRALAIRREVRDRTA